MVHILPRVVGPKPRIDETAGAIFDLLNPPLIIIGPFFIVQREPGNERGCRYCFSVSGEHADIQTIGPQVIIPQSRLSMKELDDNLNL